VTRDSTWSEVPATGSCPYSVALLAVYSPPRLMISDDAWIWFYVPAEVGQPVALTYAGQSFTYHSDQPNGIYEGAGPVPTDCDYC
jgi:hypothetical protein